MDAAKRILELDANATRGPWEAEPSLQRPDWELGAMAARPSGCVTVEKFGRKYRAHNIFCDDAPLIAEYRTLAPAVARENIRLTQLLHAIHRKVCDIDNCKLDGAPEHDAAFAHFPGGKH